MTEQTPCPQPVRHDNKSLCVVWMRKAISILLGLEMDLRGASSYRLLLDIRNPSAYLAG